MTLPSSKTQSASRREQRVKARQKNKTWQMGVILIGLALTAAAFAWLVLQPRPHALPAAIIPEKRAIRGEKISEVGWPDQQGNLVRVSDFAGQPIVINAWATWCPPCKREMPLLQAFYQQYKDQGLVLLAVNNAEEPGTVEQFIQANNFTFPILLDMTGEATNRLGIANFPTTILVDRDGVVQYIHIGELSQQMLQEVFIPFLGL